MSSFEKLIESALANYENAKNEMTAVLEEAYSIEINKREVKLNELREEITRLKAKNQDITARNRRLEIEKNVFDDCIKQVKKKCNEDMKAALLRLRKLHRYQIEIMENKYKMETERGKKLQDDLEKAIKGRQRAENEIRLIKEKMQHDNIITFQHILWQHGCRVAWDNVSQFKDIDIIEGNGEVRPFGKVVVHSYGNMDFYNYNFKFCDACQRGDPSKVNCKYVRIRQ